MKSSKQHNNLAEEINPSRNERRYMLEVEIPKEITFDLPVGNYRATIVNIKPMFRQGGDGAHEWIRFLFEVQIRSLSAYTCMAGRNFKLDLNPGSELRNWLTGLLGGRFFTDRSGTSMDLEKLIGTRCDVVLQHYQTPKYDKPMVLVAEVHPAGTLDLTEPAMDDGKD